jgi:hypothetical protein
MEFADAGGYPGRAVATPTVADAQQRRPTTDRQPEHQPRHTPANEIDARQQAAAERWAARQKNPPTPRRTGRRFRIVNNDGTHRVNPIIDAVGYKIRAGVRAELPA